MEIFSFRDKQREELLKQQCLVDTLKSTDFSIFKEGLEARKLLLDEPAGQATFAVILALFTLLSQVVQFCVTSYYQVTSRTDTQWRAAVATVSLQPGPKAYVGALNMQTFYEDKSRARDALRMVAASLPMIDNENAFDQVFSDLRVAKTNKDSNLGLEVGRALNLEYDGTLDDLEKVCDINRDHLKGSHKFEIIASLAIVSEGCDDVSDQVKRAIHLREWEIDTVTVQISGDIRNQRAASGAVDQFGKPGAPSVLDMSSVIFRRDNNNEVDLTHSNLQRANLKNSYLAHVDFTGAWLDDSDLTDADLRFAALKEARVAGAELRGADLGCATLGGSMGEWKGAKLGGIEAASIEILDGLKSKYSTAWPIGFGLTQAEVERLETDARQRSTTECKILATPK
jgi:hypothetical protein